MKSELSPFNVATDINTKTVDEFDIKIPKDMKPVTTKGSNELKRCIDLIFLEQNITRIADFSESMKYLLNPVLLTSFGIQFTSGYLNTGFTKIHYIKASKEQAMCSPIMENGKEEDLVDFTYFLHGFIRSYLEVVFISKVGVYSAGDEQSSARRFFQVHQNIYKVRRGRLVPYLRPINIYH